MKRCISILYLAFLLFFAQTSWAGVAAYGQRLCHSGANLSCLVVQPGDTWVSLWPNEEQRAMAMRVNRMNTRLHPGMQLVNPDGMSESAILNLLPFPQDIGQQNQRTILVNPGSLAWAAYDSDGAMVRWGPASTGRAFCSDIGSKCRTPLGTFVIYRKAGGSCVSSIFPIPNGGAPMPYCMFFRSGIALHGSNELPGYNASHGCVRILRGDAKWLNEDFIAVGATKVIVSNRSFREPT